MANTAGSPEVTRESNGAGGITSFSKTITGAIVGLIVIFECVAASHYLAGGDSAAKIEAKKEASAEEHAEQHDVDLGKFSLTTIDPIANTTLLIEFHLVGAVVADHFEREVKGWTEREGSAGHGSTAGALADDNTTTFGKLFKQNKNRFRDQVIMIIGNAQISDLSDPRLGLIKGQILAKTNLLLGEPLLKEVQFSDFAVVQQ